MPDAVWLAEYLDAKKSVDDRALNRYVWNALADALQEQSAPLPLRVLEVGAGSAAMQQRLLEWRLFRSDAVVDVLDTNADLLRLGRERLAASAPAHGFTVTDRSDTHLCLERPGARLRYRFVAANVVEYAARAGIHASYDLLLAHAFLDLVHLPTAVPSLLQLLAPGGLFYFTLVFDGSTAFEPTLDPDLDALVERLYHDSMDRRFAPGGGPSGGSRSGRRLFPVLRECGAHVLAAGASDWRVRPDPSGRYLAREATFLDHILTFFERSLGDDPSLDARHLHAWLAARRAQLERAELHFQAHHLDYVGRVSG